MLSVYVFMNWCNIEIITAVFVQLTSGLSPFVLVLHKYNRNTYVHICARILRLRIRWIYIFIYYITTHLCVYMYVYICECMCVCLWMYVCVLARGSLNHYMDISLDIKMNHIQKKYYIDKNTKLPQGVFSYTRKIK